MLRLTDSIDFLTGLISSTEIALAAARWLQYYKLIAWSDTHGFEVTCLFLPHES